MSFVAKIIEYIKDDQTKKFGLKEQVAITIEGEGVGIVNFKNDILTIVRMNANKCLISIEPFEPEQGLWNGADILPEGMEDGSFEASLVHDLIWLYSKDIAKANALTEQEVLKWSNGLMTAIMSRYAKKPSKLWQRVVYTTLEAGRRFYKPLKKVIGKLFLILALAVLAFAGAMGCNTPPDWVVTDAPEAIQGYQSVGGGESNE